jgi:membrane-bound lytic murein transglycosylase D
MELMSMKNESHDGQKVKKGDTLGQIAAAYDVRISDLRNWNDIPYGSKIRIGETLAIYKRPARSSQNQNTAAQKNSRPKKASDTIPGTHTVRKGETLSTIAEQHDVNLKSLQKINHLRGSRIVVGQVLKMSAGPDIAKKKNSLRQAVAQQNRYIVKSGDTLWSISRRFNISVNTLQQANQGVRKKIKPGDELTIPE